MFRANSEKPELAAAAPSAPPAADSSVYDETAHFSQRAPPPSYEESQRISSVVPQQQYHPYSQLPQAQPVYQTAPSSSYMSGNAYQWQPPPPMQQQYYQHNYPAVPQIAPIMTTQTTMYAAPSDAKSSPQVLTLAKGAKVRTTVTGAVTIPPPPPGCAPTPAQYAAMQGQPVLVKKKKNSFF